MSNLIKYRTLKNEPLQEGDEELFYDIEDGESYKKIPSYLYGVDCGDSEYYRRPINVFNGKELELVKYIWEYYEANALGVSIQVTHNIKDQDIPNLLHLVKGK